MITVHPGLLRNNNPLPPERVVHPIQSPWGPETGVLWCTVMNKGWSTTVGFGRGL